MARILHFGEDGCHRLMVLESVGYSVHRCETIQDIEFHLRSSDPPDAVIITGELPRASRVEAFLAKAELPLPVILFAGADAPHAESTFDLVIPALTSPSEWLSSIQKTIERFHGQRMNLGADSQTSMQARLL